MPFRNRTAGLVLTAVLVCGWGQASHAAGQSYAENEFSAADEYSSTPLGKCSALAPGSPSYRNDTSRVADTYVKIGNSSEGRPIWAEHWGAQTGAQILVIGQIHGDECSPAFLVEALRRKTPSGFGMWLIPTLNPDALNRGTRLTPGKIDINRDGYKLRSPEARALMKFTSRVKPALSVHVHSPYGFVGSRNGGLAYGAANAVAKAAKWHQGQGSGTLASSPVGSAFLWDGQELTVRGHRSILIEMPSTSTREASGAPQPKRRVNVSVAEARRLSQRIRDALYSYIEKV